MKLSSKVKTALVAGILAIVGVGAVAMNDAQALVNCDDGTTANTYAECGMKAADPDKGQGKTLDVTVKNIINGVLYVVGVLAVVMVIIGGVKYTTSGGDQAAVTSAKNTILYGIVGLVIAILAYAIVNFVVGQLGNG